MGTPSYMAPEQALGRLRDIGPHTDVYSLGAILYELLTGHPPFTGVTREEIRERVICDPPPPIGSDVPSELGVVCLKCLEKRPEDRYWSAAELGDALQWFLDGRGVPVASGDRETPSPTATRLDEPPKCSTADYDQPPVPGADGKHTRRWWRLWQ